MAEVIVIVARGIDRIYAYHSTSDCPALHSSRSEHVDLAKANARQRGRGWDQLRPCRRCHDG